jgi:hypothetical protein
MSGSYHVYRANLRSSRSHSNEEPDELLGGYIPRLLWLTRDNYVEKLKRKFASSPNVRVVSEYHPFPRTGVLGRGNAQYVIPPETLWFRIGRIYWDGPLSSFGGTEAELLTSAVFGSQNVRQSDFQSDRTGANRPVDQLIITDDNRRLFVEVKMTTGCLLEPPLGIKSTRSQFFALRVARSLRESAGAFYFVWSVDRVDNTNICTLWVASIEHVDLFSFFDSQLGMLRFSTGQNAYYRKESDGRENFNLFG